MGSVTKFGRIANRRSAQFPAPTGSREGVAAYFGHITYEIHLFIHFCVRTKLDDSGSRDYNRFSGGGAGLAWNDVLAMWKV